MTPTEAAALLTMASAFDNRKVTREAAQAWATTLDRIRLEDAREALQRHFRDSNDWLMPKHITTHVRRIRHERLEAYGTLPDPPRELDADDTAAVIRWQRDVRRRIADGEDVPRPALTGRRLDPAALESLMPRIPTDDRPARGDDVKHHADAARAAIRTTPTTEENA